MATTPSNDYLFTASKNRPDSEKANSKLNSEGSKAKAKVIFLTIASIPCTTARIGFEDQPNSLPNS